jgi:hypothetical protein
MPITALPTPPSRVRPTTFSTEADAFLAALPQFQSEANILALGTNSNEVAAAAWALATALDAVTCQGAVSASLAASGAVAYSVVTTYDFPDTVVGSDGGTYRCMGTGVLADNPVGSVTGNWLKLTVSEPTVNIKTINFAITPDITYLVDTAAGAITGTLPATPAAGQRVHVGDYNNKFIINNCTLARNGKNIMGLAEDLILNIDCFVTLIYVDSTIGWRIIK